MVVAVVGERREGGGRGKASYVVDDNRMINQYGMRGRGGGGGEEKVREGEREEEEEETGIVLHRFTQFSWQTTLTTSWFIQGDHKVLP